VCGNLLDAASMAAAAMGASRRLAPHITRIAMFSYWANSYCGGAVAAIGGALVLGAWPRIVRHQRLGDGLLLGLGLAILANSQPYEGFILAGSCVALSVGVGKAAANMV